MKWWPPRLPASKTGRALLALPIVVAIGLAFWIHPPNVGVIATAFTQVRWEWVVVAILAESPVGHRARARMDDGDQPGDAAAASGVMLVFSAFSVGLFANAVLPGGSASSRASRC